MIAHEHTLTVHAGEAVVRMTVASGLSVREALDATALRVRAACGGTGTCGACVVRLLAGEVSAPTVADHLRLSPAERARGLRLACQLRLSGDAEIGLDLPAPPSPWRSIPAEELVPPPTATARPEHNPLGVAVDLGTTHIRASLWDRRAGRRVATRQGGNPQAAFGADVLNRLGVAAENPERARELARLARLAVIDATRDMLARDLGSGGSAFGEIGRVVLVGNTAMLALLTGRAESLLDPRGWERFVECRPADPRVWLEEWGFPSAEVVLAQPVAGFVGSDLVADVLATDLTGGPAPALLLDVGTNTELALWDGTTLHVAAVPGGSAFEGSGRGLPAEPGAVFRVVVDDSGRYVCRVIGGGEPRGFCGSGLVDAIAVLLAAGALSPSGRFADAFGRGGVLLHPREDRTAITPGDVDAFQRAKAATASACEVLFALAGLRGPELARVCLCGAFGQTLDVANARAVGLLPRAPVPVELHAGAALAGCERALLSADPEGLLAGAVRGARAVNLALVEEYEDRFIDHLRLQPVGWDGGRSHVR